MMVLHDCHSSWRPSFGALGWYELVQIVDADAPLQLCDAISQSSVHAGSNGWPDARFPISKSDIRAAAIRAWLHALCFVEERRPAI